MSLKEAVAGYKQYQTVNNSTKNSANTLMGRILSKQTPVVSSKNGRASVQHLGAMRSTKTIGNIPTVTSIGFTKSPKIKSTSGPLTIDLTKLVTKQITSPTQGSGRFGGTPVARLNKPSSAISTKNA